MNTNTNWKQFILINMVEYSVQSILIILSINMMMIMIMIIIIKGEEIANGVECSV